MPQETFSGANGRVPPELLQSLNDAGRIAERANAALQATAGIRPTDLDAFRTQQELDEALRKYEQSIRQSEPETA